jgi:predicted transcriptional regulator
MPKPSYLTIRVSPEQRAQIEMIADMTDQPASAIVQQAVDEFLDRMHAGAVRIDDAGQSVLIDMFKRWVRTN